jgi:hypothetical protein
MEKLVKESIDFKRGTSSKTSLGVGKVTEFAKTLNLWIGRDTPVILDLPFDSLNITLEKVEDKKVHYYHQNPNPLANSNDYWMNSYFFLGDIDEIDEDWDHPTIFMKNPLPSEEGGLEEALDFKRGISSKEALNIGKAKNDKLIAKLAKNMDDVRLFNFYKNWNPESHIWADLRHNDPWTITFYTDDLADEHIHDNKIKQRFHKDNIDRIEVDKDLYNVYLIEPEA